MRRLKLLLLLALMPAMALQASAWGPQAQKQFCQDAVYQVWGQRGIDCLQDRTAYCLNLKELLNDSVSRQCLDAYAAGVEILPYNAAEVLFNDVENFYNFDTCPLTWARANNEWICSGKGNPAGAAAQRWFDLARGSQDYCEQVRAFCTGSPYYTNSYFPLYQVTYLQGCIGGSIDSLTDAELLSNRANWTVKEQCVFSYIKEMAGVSRRTTQHVTFVLTNNDYEAVYDNLTLQAEYVVNPSLMPATTTTLSAATTTSLPVEGQPSTTTSTETTSTTTTSATTTTSETSSSSTTTTTQPATTTTTIPMENETVSADEANKAKLNQSIEEIDSMFNDVLTSINKTKADKTPKSDNLAGLAVTGLVLLASVILLVYLYSVMRRPTVHPPRKVVLPPSVRRRMKKGE